VSTASPSKPFEQLLMALSPRRRALERLRSGWGKPGTRDGWLADRYFDLTRDGSASKDVDDRTWGDLEFPKIFSVFDSTLTPLGSQTLYRMMRRYLEDDGELADRYRMYEQIRSDTPLREEIQLRLAALDADSNAGIADFVFGELPEMPRYRRLAPWSGLLSAATLAGVITLSVPIALWIAIVAINFAIFIRATRTLIHDNEQLESCYGLLRVADHLARIQPGAQQLLMQLVEETRVRASARRKLRWFALSQGTIASNILAPFNVAFLLEYSLYVRTIDQIARIQPILASTYRLVGSLDATIAIASWFERSPGHCLPTIAARSEIDIEEGHHPLIADPVRNSVRLDGRSALVAGSNMAGKTTFIKMIGINVILGRTLGFCLASRVTIPRSSAMASIRGEQSVESGKSHFFAEIEAIHSFIELAAAGDCRLFVIDELFNGTNTVERLATARAVLESLCRHAQVLVTTHDVELQAVLAEHYELFHFREDPDVDGFYDFRLREGASTARNAIRLLERKGFPSDIVARAMEYAAEATGS
jgi:DNA mismatch repair ATPase MutS